MREISFREDVLPLKDKLFRLALRITSDRMEAEDIVQDTLIRVWNKREEWAGMESIEAYCLAVARNLAIDRSEKKVAQTVELAPDMEYTAEATGPHEHLEQTERMSILHRLINGLPEKQRTIMQLRDVYNKYHARGFEIYQVALDPDEHFWKTQTAALPWISVRDADGLQSHYLQLYNVQSIPTFFLVGRDNALDKRDVQIKDLDAEIEALLGK